MVRILFQIGAFVAVLLATRSSVAQSTLLPSESEVQVINFDRHVQPLLSKLGCNSGSCHGHSAGKGDFKLSLFGYDSQLDFNAINNSDHGRLDRSRPRESLFLQKPTQQVEHGGGVRFTADSWEYDLLRNWIAQGGKKSDRIDPLTNLEVIPAKSLLAQDDTVVKLKVLASFASGEKMDVTPFCSLRAANDSVVELQQETIRRRHPGDTTIVATYAGWSASGHFLVPVDSRDATGTSSTQGRSESSNLIDQVVEKRLLDLRIHPTEICDDSTFLRRLTLATTGQLPDLQSIHRFVAQTSPTKREDAIQRMLGHSLHASVLATRMCEITGSRDLGNAELRPETALEAKWHGWFRERFARNEPYDSVVRQVLVATTRDALSANEFIENAMAANADGRLHEAADYSQKPSLDLFWQRSKVNEEVDVESLAERISAAFLGVRIECAKCHKHPFDRWTQDDYRSFANLFTQVRFGLSGDLRIAVADKLQQQRESTESTSKRERVPSLREVYLTTKPVDFLSARDQSKLPAKPLMGTAIICEGDRRIAFADWLLDDANPFFARNFVNRVWGFYFGAGLIDPIDAYSASNPPAYPELLDALATEFIESNYDVRMLETLILNSNAWQRSAESTARNDVVGYNFARFQVRVLPAYAIVDSIACALNEQATPTAGLPAFATENVDLQPYFNVFSRPERKSRCDCERSDHPTLRQAMLLLSDQGLTTRIDTSVRKLLSDRNGEFDSSQESLIEHLFLSALERRPTIDEQNSAHEHIVNASSLEQAASDILWSLINTREFVTLH